jgi:hypothetical protein
MLPETHRKAIFIANVLNDVFGINCPVYLPTTRERSYVATPFGDVRVVTPEEAERMSSFGTPVMGSFILEAGEYNSYDREGRMVKVRMNDFVMPASTIVDFSRDMVMTRTRTLGNTGTVKEIYGLDDRKIDIRGVCMSDRNGEDPRSAREQLDEPVLRRNICAGIGVPGGIFERKNIRRICIESFAIRPVQAKWDEVPFDITACSDEAIELAYL